MGFYLRKAFSAGPIRFNLSKSGLGASFGVTGARIGLSSRGGAYVHGGRHGLYYRKSLGGGRRRAAGGGAGAADDDAGPLELTEDTGVTYGKPAAATGATARTAPAPTRSTPRTYGGLALVAVAASLVLPEPWSVVVAAAVIAGLLVLVVRRRMHRTAGDAYGRFLDEQAAAEEGLGADARAALDAARGERWLTAADARYFEERVYGAALEAATAAGPDDDRAFARVRELEDLFDLDAEFRRRARLDAYVRAHVEAVSDHDLTAAEEQALERARTAFELTDEELVDELALLEKLRELREIRAGRLPEVEAEAKLPGRGETCHLESRGRILKTRLLRSFTRDGRRHKVRGFVIDKEGALLVTSKRVALIHKGVTSYPLRKILDVEVDQDRQLLVLTRDGVATPTCLTTPDALRAGAIVAALTESG